MSGVIDALPFLKADLDEAWTVAYYFEGGDEHGKPSNSTSYCATPRRLWIWISYINARRVSTPRT